MLIVNGQWSLYCQSNSVIGNILPILQQYTTHLERLEKHIFLPTAVLESYTSGMTSSSTLVDLTTGFGDDVADTGNGFLNSGTFGFYKIKGLKSDFM